MGRAGGGSRGGGHSGGGGHRMSRSGGGHRVGSSFGGGSRAGSGGGNLFRGSRGRTPSGGGMGGHGGPGMPPPIIINNGPRRSGRRRSGGGVGGCLTTVIVVLLIFMIIGMSQCGRDDEGSSGQEVKSTIVREKLDSGNAYINDCIVDELGWFDHEASTEMELKKFWEKTGVQPYILLRDYDPSLTTDAQKEDWAKDYYDENFDTENIFLFVYFAERDTDNDVGYMCYANGFETSSVMDSEAIEIFWNNIDKYWHSDMSTDELFTTVFTKTGDTIMSSATAKAEVKKWILIVLAVVIVGAVVIVLVSKRNKRKQEEAAEKQRILETPLEDLVKEKEKEMKE